MRVLLQRVTSASVSVAGQSVGAISIGLLVFLGVSKFDSEKDVDYLAEKILGLRIFPDADGKMNVNVVDSGGGILVISQFTLYGDCRKGRRPSFDDAARPELAQHLYEYFLAELRRRGIDPAAGIFQADMQVSLTNDGPVTFLLESPQRSL